jgi:hypothetical protein
LILDYTATLVTGTPVLSLKDIAVTIIEVNNSIDR